MKKAVRLVVNGTVQGVFYRQFCKENADKLNVKGFVRNLENGNVEIIAEGDIKNIERFVELCRKGPSHAMIKNAEVEERKWGGEFSDFRVLRF